MNHTQTSTASSHHVTIIINTKPFEVPKEITFEEVVSFAFGSATGGESVAFTVTYRRGHGEKPAGSLVEGASVKTKEGMIFNVTKTDKS